MHKPTIQDVMTRSPHTIGHDQTLRAAHRMMQTHNIRHLPVVDGGQLVGVLSQRDLYLIESLEGVDLDEVHVSEAMSSDIFTVRSRVRLDRIVAEMTTRKLGSAIVIERNAVVGVFTVIDALGVLARLLDSFDAAAEHPTTDRHHTGD
jgi:acetoin utilization protein AcuB